MNSLNLNKLITEALAIEKEEAITAGAIGYMARALIQATLPHSQIDGNEFKRHNGAFSLTILADSEIGLPYGSIPRLLISWITTEAVKTKGRELILGRTLSEFMLELDLGV
jgi:Plasmid encoded RepA protein